MGFLRRLGSIRLQQPGLAPMANVYHGDHPRLAIDPVDDSVSPAPRAESVVEWRKKTFPGTMRLR
jgi:hypothetical protein